MKTILLDQLKWDFVIDANRNIAVASNPYSLAQDAASAIKVFLGEAWYDTLLGVPYWAEILGFPPNASLMKAQFRAQAILVPEVADATVFITAFKNRTITGQVDITSQARATATAFFNQTGQTP